MTKNLIHIVIIVFNKVNDTLINTKTLFFTGAFIFLVSTASFKEESKIYMFPDLVVGVAQWRHESGPVMTIQEETFLNLTEKLDSMALTKVSVVKIPAALQNANNVDSIAAEFEVDVIVWGWYDEDAVRGFVDLANATQEDGLTNSLSTFLENGESTEIIRVLKVLSEFDYFKDGVFFCVPRWTP